ncbi:octopamine receptor 1-like [Actinia tenebrosa]|uniref:Octopamine receptor 1-like n=1 Tax=Actinia tenebrosa TaxID=6105 RepID=A0A6P8HRJ7_ACTTE|nr:octopamine receptor 1-like [Actinia tenebrosa]
MRFFNTSSTSNQSNNFTSEGSSTSKDGIGVVSFKYCVILITITATIVGNTLIYAAIAKFQMLRTPTNIILVSLASTDLAMVLVMSLHAITDLSDYWIFGELWCDIVATLGLVLALVSILHLCVLSIDRYLAIKTPLRYPLTVTKRRVYMCLVFIWTFPTIFLNLPVADYHFRSEVYGCGTAYRVSESFKFKPYIFVVVFLFVVVPFGIMLYTHAFVFRIALTHVKRLSTVERSLRTRGEETESTQRRTQPVMSVKREIKSAKTFALVIGVFLFCYTPFFVTGTYRRVAGPEAIHNLATFITTWLAFANSFSNPLVYSLRYSPFKKAFRKLCRCEKGRGRGNGKMSISGSRKLSPTQAGQCESREPKENAPNT